jgi:hypothetical protein
MLFRDSRAALVLAKERARRLREETAIDQVGRSARMHRSAAASLLRQAADRLDPTPLAHRVA